jgi:hypothetical protein
VVLRIIVLVCVTACSQSLFDNTKDNGDGGSDIPSECTAPCVADAAKDFGPNAMRWRYLEDKRDRTWTPMTADGGAMVGTDTNNRITKCAADSSEHACQALPGALLVASAGFSAAADPALEMTAPMNQVVKVTVKVHVPVNGLAQQVRIYRNSREDVLVTAMAAVGDTYQTTVTLDGLAGDRLLLSLAGAAAAQGIGVHMYVSGEATPFPSTCQLALSFTGAVSNPVANACGGGFTATDDTTGNPTTPSLIAGPFPEHGDAADIAKDRYYVGTDILTRTADSTLQFWVKVDALDPVYTSWPVSDEDLDDVKPGGLGIGIYDPAAPKILGDTCTQGTPPLMFSGAEAAYPNDGKWHFVRVVHESGTVSLCLDGQKTLMFPAATIQSKYRLHLGKNVIWTPAGAFFDGAIDDVRSFVGALPCD